MASSNKEAPVFATRKLNDIVNDFMASTRVRKAPDAYCRADAFIKAFKDFCKDEKTNPDIEESRCTVDYLTTLSGVTIERDTYLPYPGKNGALQKNAWVKGLSIVADDLHGEQLSVLLGFVKQAKLVFDTSIFMKYQDFLKVFEAFCLENRHAFFKPSARLVKEICIRFNLALDASGVRKYRDDEPMKSKWLLGADFA
jgi:hypothetical protein